MEAWQALSTGFVFAFIRSLGLIVMLPIERDLQGWAGGLAVAALLGVFFAPLVQVNDTAIWLQLPLEFVMGALLGLPLATICAVASICGEAIDVARGQSLSELYDPLNGSSTSTLSVLFRGYLWVTLLLSGMLEVLLKYLARSFELPSASSDLGAYLTSSAPLIMKTVAGLLTELMEVLLPVMLIFFLIEIFAGFLSKALPRVSLQTEAFILKSGLAFLYLGCLIRSEHFYSFASRARPMLPGLGL